MKGNLSVMEASHGGVGQEYAPIQRPVAELAPATVRFKKKVISKPSCNADG